MASFSIDHVVVGEGDGLVQIVVRLDGALANTAYSVDSPHERRHRRRADFTGVATTTLNFAAGVTTQTIQIAITDNATVESFEKFWILLSNASAGATISNNVATVGIVDNDNGRHAAAQRARRDGVDEKAGTATFVVMLNGPDGGASASPVTVDYATDRGHRPGGHRRQRLRGHQRHPHLPGRRGGQDRHGQPHRRRAGRGLRALRAEPEQRQRRHRRRRPGAGHHRRQRRHRGGATACR